MGPATPSSKPDDAVQGPGGGALDRLPRGRLERGTTRRGEAVLHTRYVERGSPPSAVVPNEVEVVPLPPHPRLDVADPLPRVQPGTERAEGCLHPRGHADQLVEAEVANISARR